MRPAIAMIELIFAIMVMGIVLMSAPRLIGVAAKSGYIAIQQEAINEASTQVNLVMNQYWDEALADDTMFPPVLRTTNGDADLQENNNTGLRNGTPRYSSRSFVRSDGSRLNASVLGPDGGDRDDVDDFIGTSSLTIIQDAGKEDYIEKNVGISTNVTYINDTGSGYNATTLTFVPNFSSAPAGSTNIKAITVTLTSGTGTAEELDKNIVLRGFSCNIGATKFEEREF